MRALLSVSDKTGLVPFAAALAGRGVGAGVDRGDRQGPGRRPGLPVIGISDVTGFPEMMDGRVKTLHPKVHGGILARRHRADDLAALAAHGITPDRPRRRQPVSVRAGGGAAGHCRSTT